MKIRRVKDYLKPIVLLFITNAIIGIACAQARAQTITGLEGTSYFKADLHTHYSFSNPLATEVARYREAGYNFVVLSTKDMQDVLDYEAQSTDDMRIVAGVEQSFITLKNKLGHVLAFRVKTPFRFTDQWTMKQGLQKLKDKYPRVILGINHPNDQRWTLEDVMEAWELGAVLFELNSADMKQGEFETALWDAALTAGARLYATLVNDVHHIDDIDAYGYILIQAPDMSAKSITEALSTGAFYAVESGFSADIQHHELMETPDGTTVIVSAPGAARIRFIGENGALLNETAAESASYVIKTNTKYVRVEIIDKNGRYAFMQPFFMK